MHNERLLTKTWPNGRTLSVSRELLLSLFYPVKYLRRNSFFFERLGLRFGFYDVCQDYLRSNGH